MLIPSLISLVHQDILMTLMQLSISQPEINWHLLIYTTLFSPGVLAGHDPLDSTTVRDKFVPFDLPGDININGVSVGIPKVR